MNDEKKADQIGWAVVELMGHRKLGAYVTETTLAGAGFLRLDVPDKGATEAGPWVATQIVNPTSLYCLTPTTREIAVALAESCRPAPVSTGQPVRVAGPGGAADDGELPAGR